MSVVSVPIAAKRLIAPAAVAAMFHRTLALAARAAIRGSLGLFAKGHNGLLCERAGQTKFPAPGSRSGRKFSANIDRD